MYNIIYLQNLVTYDKLNNMERNSNTTGGDNNDFEDIMREGGVSDELTPPIAGRTGGLSQLSKA